MKVENIIGELNEFSEFSKADIQIVVENMDNQTLDEGAIFIQENTACQSLYILIKGKVMVYRTTAASVDIEKIGQLNPGAIIGLGSLLGHGIASASCKAMTNIELVSLQFSKYKKMCATHKHIKYQFQLSIAKQLANEMRNYNHYMRFSFSDQKSPDNSIYSCEYRGLERRQNNRRTQERRKQW